MKKRKEFLFFLVLEKVRPLFFAWRRTVLIGKVSMRRMPCWCFRTKSHVICMPKLFPKKLELWLARSSILLLNNFEAARLQRARNDGCRAHNLKYPKSVSSHYFSGKKCVPIVSRSDYPKVVSKTSFKPSPLALTALVHCIPSIIIF